MKVKSLENVLKAKRRGSEMFNFVVCQNLVHVCYVCIMWYVCVHNVVCVL